MFFIQNGSLRKGQTARGVAQTLAVVVFVLVVLITIILLVLPLEGTETATSTVILYDNLFILRCCFIAVGGLVALVALGYVTVNHFMQPVYAKPLKIN